MFIISHVLNDTHESISMYNFFLTFYTVGNADFFSSVIMFLRVSMRQKEIKQTSYLVRHETEA